MDNKISQHVVNENVIVFGVVTQVVMVSLLFGVVTQVVMVSLLGMALQWRSGVCIAYWRNEQTEPRTSAVWQDFAKNKVQ